MPADDSRAVDVTLDSGAVLRVERNLFCLGSG